MVPLLRNMENQAPETVARHVRSLDDDKLPIREDWRGQHARIPAGSPFHLPTCRLMPGATELEQYLEELQVEGNLQSRGQFTLDFHKALEKLSGMAGQNVHRWVFFAVQAAVGFGAAEMRISASSQAM